MSMTCTHNKTSCQASSLFHGGLVGEVWLAQCTQLPNFQSPCTKLDIPLHVSEKNTVTRDFNQSILSERFNFYTQFNL